MMQYLSKNLHCVILPELYCMNDQYIKEKYGINKCSAAGAQNGESHHFGEYSNFTAWKNRWGWDYTTLEHFSVSKYQDTLINEFYHFDLMKSNNLIKHLILTINKFKNKVIIVIGGAGAVGVNLIESLIIHEPKKIYVIDNLSSGEKEFYPSRAYWNSFIAILLIH